MKELYLCILLLFDVVCPLSLRVMKTVIASFFMFSSSDTDVSTCHVGGQTKEQTFTLLLLTEHGEHSCVCGCPLCPSVPLRIIIFLRIPSFRRTPLRGPQQGFSSPIPAGLSAGLHLHNLGTESSISQDQMMRSGVGLCILGLLSLCSSSFGQDTVEVQHGVLIFCDDPSVEKAVSSALQTLNKELTTGHKLALFQILSAKKSENGSDSVYSLEFTSRKSDCSAGSSKPWSDCDYLQPGHRAPISCNATVHMTETDTDTKQVDCLFDKHVVAAKAPTCMGCPLQISEDSEDLKVPLSASIAKFNVISNSTHLFTLHSVGHATRQVIAGFRFKLRFDMKKTTCPKEEHKDLNDLCVPDEDNVEFATCNSTVDMAPWRFEQPEAHIQCEPGALPAISGVRRRPAGWSPLRGALKPNTSSHLPAPLPPETQPTTNAPAKKDSSEEDTTASNPSASPSVNDHPFHCPSKPWKPFKRVHTPEVPPVEGTFSDTDLLSS